MANKPRVYTSPSAFPNPQRLRLFALEKGIEDELEEVIYDMTPGGDQREWPHLKMNPWGETPPLEFADGSYLAETAGIVRYLDLAYPGRKVTGEMPLEQGQEVMRDNRIWVHVLYRIVTMFHVVQRVLSSSSSSRTTPRGASTAARRRSPAPPSSTLTSPTGGTGFSAATSRRSRTSCWRPRSPSRSSL